MKYVANKRLQIFWICLYTLFLLGIFAERVYCTFFNYFCTAGFLTSILALCYDPKCFFFIDYYIEREHFGLRRILGYGLTITRGAASAIMFAYSTLLSTMCHNIITILRTTVLQFYGFTYRSIQ